jgi:CheY-like chemotaxis protein
VRCLIVDDSADFANAARHLLERDGDTVVDVASTGAEALRCFEKLRPDVTLVDVNLGAESGFDLAEQLHRSGLPTPPPVILISTHAEQDFADMIATSPAIGFLSKMVLTDAAIRDLVDGRRLMVSQVDDEWATRAGRRRAEEAGTADQPEQLREDYV